LMPYSSLALSMFQESLRGLGMAASRRS